MIQKYIFSLSTYKKSHHGFQWEMMLKSVSPLFQASQSLYAVNSQHPSSGMTAGSTM